jgi:ribose transport system permease protein
MGSRTIAALKRQPVWLILLASVSLFTLLSNDFLTFRNIANIILQSSILGIMAVGMTGLMISGYFDISVGSLLALTAAVAVSLTGYSITLAMIVTLICGAAFGAINGLLVTKAKVNAFIVTLAAMVGVRGLVYVYTKEREIIGLATEFEKLAAAKVASIPLPIIIWVIIIIIAEWTLRKTVYGRNAYAIGGDAESTKNAGVSVDKYVLGLFVLNGFFVAIAGLILASRLNAATPTLGIGQEMMVIISVVLGGTKLTGGFGNMIKTVAGVLTIGMIQNGLNILNVHHFYSMLIMGLIFIFVIFMDAKLSKAK